MTSTYTDNFELVKQGAGDNVDTWGDPLLNTNMIQRVDDALGKTTTIALTSSSVNLTQTQWRSKALLLTGTISAHLNIVLPLSVNSVGSATAVGGEFIIDNQTVGAFTITVKTAATASTGVEVPQGYRSTLYSDGVDVTYADDQARSTLQTYAGNPNGNVAGTAGSSTTPASILFDRTNQSVYVCTTSGDASTAVWSPVTGPINPPQGYLTASSSATNVILTADSIGATTIYYSPYVGNFCPVFNGTSFVPISFAQLPLVLTASQAANGIYDVIAFVNNSALQIGFSPSWAAGSGGSVAAGSCARGTGAGGAAIQRIGGVWVNTAAMTVNNGATTYSVAALRGTVIGSVFIDSTQGQVTCHRSFGQSRKWGIFNFYNRIPTTLQSGDSNASWTYTSATVRAANGDANNKCMSFFGLAEEGADCVNNGTGTGAGTNNGWTIGIGLNSTTANSGVVGRAETNVGGGGKITVSGTYLLAPTLGINNVQQLESGNASNTTTFLGSSSGLTLYLRFRA